MRRLMQRLQFLGTGLPLPAEPRAGNQVDARQP